MNETKKEIANLYASGTLFTSDIAKQFLLSVKTVNRIAKEAGVLRSRSETNKLFADKKDYSGMKASKVVKTLRSAIEPRLRALILTSNPKCSSCGIFRFQGTRLEVYPPTKEVVCVKCLLKNKNKYKI